MPTCLYAPLVNNSVAPNVKPVSALRGLPWSQAAVWSNGLIRPRDGKVPMRDVFVSPSGDRFAEVILFLVWIAVGHFETRGWSEMDQLDLSG
jgi:hypothetical protein